ncbi:Ankyrin repeat family protein [Prunus dulcis]|uniref:Ankyrin repeat family protein n=1 Tax=Prunus dulcis TaxID=3755 RepID=A0A4Y1R661_PRUDU|nr:Ankyrin repeat family protein [Prunus dulcis]
MGTHFTAKENSHQLQLLHNTNVLKAYNIRRGSFSFHGAEKHSNPHGTWEDPDDGSGSEDEEETEEHDLGFQSEWEEEGEEEKGAPAAASVDRSTTNKYEEELVKGKMESGTYSCTIGLVTFMDKLLDDGVDINVVDKDGLTALHTAIIAKKEAVISHLLRKGASPHIRDGDGATPLHYAVQVGTKRIVKLLIKYKVDVNVADNDGWTPLHIAVQSRNRDIAKILLVNGADKSRRNEDGRTPLDLGLCYGKDFKSYDLTKLLKTVPMDREF